MAKKAEWNIKNLRSWAEPETACVLLVLVILLPSVILDLGDCETFSADYMEIVRFFFLILDEDFGVRIICGCGLFAGNYGTARPTMPLYPDYILCSFKRHNKIIYTKL